MANTQEIILGGDGKDKVEIPPCPFRLWVDLIAYHDGIGPGGQYALLALYQGEGQIRLGQAEDRNFDHYYLEVRKAVLLDANSAASFGIEWDNKGAKTTRHGLIATARLA